MHAPQLCISFTTPDKTHVPHSNKDNIHKPQRNKTMQHAQNANRKNLIYYAQAFRRILL